MNSQGGSAVVASASVRTGTGVSCPAGESVIVTGNSAGFCESVISKVDPVLKGESYDH